MLEKLFIQIMNMSLTAGIAILAVCAARLLLRRAPKAFSYAMWAVVLFRLLCPFSFSNAFSLLGMLETPAARQGQMEYIPETIGYDMQPVVELPVPAVNTSLPPGNPKGSVNPLVWIAFFPE